jgi:hypothetical protein
MLIIARYLLRDGVLFWRSSMFCLKRYLSLAAVAPLVVSLSACSGGGSGSVPVLNARSSAVRLASAVDAGVTALSADSLPGDHDAANNFIDSIGVNTHLTFANSVYQNYPAVKNALVNLGVRHVRDTFKTTNPQNFEANLGDLAASGVHSVLTLAILPDANNNAVMDVPADQAVAYLQAGHFLGSIEAVEGINEPDVNQGNPGGPSPLGWAALTQSQQQILYTGIAGLSAPARPMPVYGPSIQVVSSELQQVGNLSTYMDYGNIHDYSGGYNLLGTQIASAVSLEQAVSGTKPILATENGYATGTTGQGIPNSVMLDYAERLFFSQFANGVKRTLWYELLDENTTPNDYWHNAGLLTTTYAPKPAYTGLKNIVALLHDQTSYKPRTALNVSFGGQIQFENIGQLLLQKNDGSFWLAVWRDASEWTPAANGVPGSAVNPQPATVPNSMNFLGTYVASITEYDEDDNGIMTSQTVPVSAGNTAQVSIGPRPKLFKIVPGVAPVAPPAVPVIPNPTAHWSLDEGSGSVAADSVNGAGNMPFTPGPKAVWVAGQYNAGLSFAGTEASTNGVFLDTTQSYSATAWVQMNNLSGYQAAVAVNGLTQSAFAIDFTPQSNLSFTVYSKDSSAAAVSRIGSTFVPVIGKWYPVAVTYNGTSRLMSLYVNGVLQSTGTAAGVFTATGGTELGSMLQGGIGHWQFWNGGVDEVNLYQYELTPAQAQTMAGH